MNNTTSRATVDTLLEWIYRITQADNKDYLKRVYATFIDKVTFNSEKKTIAIQMMFSESVVAQVKKYQHEAGVPLVGAPASAYFQKEVVMVI